MITSDKTQKPEIVSDHIQEEIIGNAFRNLADTTVEGIINHVPSVEFKADRSTGKPHRWEENGLVDPNRIGILKQEWHGP